MKKDGIKNFNEFVKSDEFQKKIKNLNSKTIIDSGQHSAIHLLKFNNINYIVKKAMYDVINKKYEGNLINEKKVSDRARKYTTKNIVIPKIYHTEKDGSFSIMEYLELKKIKSFGNFSAIMEGFSKEKQIELNNELTDFLRKFHSSEVKEIEKVPIHIFKNEKDEDLLIDILYHLNITVKIFGFLTHGDLHQNNFLFTKDNRIAILDWETGGYEPDIQNLEVKIGKNKYTEENKKRTYGIHITINSILESIYSLKLKKAMDILNENYINKRRNNVSFGLFIEDAEFVIRKGLENIEKNKLNKLKAVIRLKLNKNYRNDFFKLKIAKSLRKILYKIYSVEAFLWNKTNRKIKFNKATNKIRRFTEILTPGSKENI